MKNKYNTYRTYNDYNDDYKDGQYINITDYVKEYSNYYNMSDFIETETKEEKLAREKAERRNKTIELILGDNN